MNGSAQPLQSRVIEQRTVENWHSLWRSLYYCSVSKTFIVPRSDIPPPSLPLRQLKTCAVCSATLPHSLSEPRSSSTIKLRRCPSFLVFRKAWYCTQWMSRMESIRMKPSFRRSTQAGSPSVNVCNPRNQQLKTSQYLVATVHVITVLILTIVSIVNGEYEYKHWQSCF